MNNNEEPTLELDDGELSLNDDEPTMQIDEEADGELLEDNALGLSDDEVGAEDGYEEMLPPAAVEEVLVEVPSAGSFNALLAVSFLAYVGALAVLLYRLAQYSAPGTFPWYKP